MENKCKQFNAFDKVLVKHHTDSIWNIDFYSHYNNKYKCHETYSASIQNEDRILPFEGNEHLVGTTDEPEEEVKLEEGEWVMAFLYISDFPFECHLRKFESTKKEHIKAQDGSWSPIWPYCIKFSDFNPNDIEETKKHILCVKNGKIVRYYGEN